MSTDSAPMVCSSKAPTARFEYVLGPDQPETLRLAEEMRRYVLRDLNLTHLQIMWYRPFDREPDDIFVVVAPAKVNGFAKNTEPGCIWIRADISPEQVRRTVAHEAKHLEQFTKWGPDRGIRRPRVIATWDDEAEVLMEADAAQYGAWADWVFPKHGRRKA